MRKVTVVSVVMILKVLELCVFPQNLHKENRFM